MSASADRQGLFDEWAADYDRDVAETTGFPFAGYERAIAATVEMARPSPGERVLDLGTGTGRLAKLFTDRGCVVTAVDFSPAMLVRAARRVPSATFLSMDLLGDWSQLAGQRFDVLTSAYVVHELDDETKLDVVGRLRENHLREGGRLVLADIAFETRALREQARLGGDGWDDSEHYWVAEEALPAFEKLGIRVEFRRISFCAGVVCVR